MKRIVETYTRTKNIMKEKLADLKNNQIIHSYKIKFDKVDDRYVYF